VRINPPNPPAPALELGLWFAWYWLNLFLTDYDVLLLDCTIIRFNDLIDEIYQSWNLIGK